MSVIRSSVFNNKYLKQNAKQAIRKNLFICAGIYLIYSLISKGFFGIQSNIETGQNFFYIGLGSAGSLDMTVELNILSFEVGIMTAAVILLLSLLYGIFVSNPMKVGICRYFLENRKQPSHLEAIFYAFNSRYYLNIVKVMFLREIYIAFWTLLFIVPGIIKSIEYSMIPAILAENPDMDYEEVFGVTRSLTNGYKLDLFVLDFSFIGWEIVCAFTFGIGYFFLNPYIHATEMEAYCFLRDSAIDEGILEKDEVILEVNLEESDSVILDTEVNEVDEDVNL